MQDEHFNKIIGKAVPVLMSRARKKAEFDFLEKQRDLEVAVLDVEATKAGIQASDGSAESRDKHRDAVELVSTLRSELETLRKRKDYLNTLPAELECFRDHWDTFGDEALLDALIVEQQNSLEDEELDRMEAQLAAAKQRKADRGR